MNIPDNTFWHVVFDPPHFHKGAGATGRIAFDFGLLPDNWRDMLRDGFTECFRVLKPHGTLIFKWCEAEIPLREVLALTREKPLYGHRSGKKAQTHWIAFMKPNMVSNAIKTGKLVRQQCCRCGDAKTVAHHEDYDKPLDVMWLCQVCHKQRHKEIKTP